MAYVNSAWGYQAFNVEDPDPGSISNSAWGYAVVKVRSPHFPITVITESGYENVPILLWDGTDWI